MTAFSFHSVTPHPQLVPYVAKMHMFESSGRLPVEDNKLIVPNANLKLTLTWRNGIVAGIGDKTFIQKENELSLSGLIDAPVLLDPQHDAQTGTVIVEFKPLGAYRLFHLPYAELKNKIIDFTCLMDKPAEDLKWRLAGANTVPEKLQLLQDFLLRQLEKTAPDLVYDYCIKRIADTKGIITVGQLEKETGYSTRWLHTKFTEHLGTGAKNLAEIIRFKQFYEVYSSGTKLQGLKDHIYQYYHDQSHFIRAFKRFTGFTPTELQNSMNELATKHYTS